MSLFLYVVFRIMDRWQHGSAVARTAASQQEGWGFNSTGMALWKLVTNFLDDRERDVEYNLEMFSKLEVLLKLYFYSAHQK